MPQPAPSQPSPSLPTFAGLLATLASPPPQPQSDTNDDVPPWNSSDLGEDVATLSYERALRSHARYRPATRDLDRESVRVDGSLMAAADPGSGAGATVAVRAAPALQAAAARESDLRSASVTIRLSRPECARLHQRAAEAGLTVSAYLRSCTVEAEGLRAQVKQALAELKAGAEGSSHSGGQKPLAAGIGREPGNEKTARQTSPGWMRWLARRGR